MPKNPDFPSTRCTLVHKVQASTEEDARTAMEDI
jgi:hypothetical protein